MAKIRIIGDVHGHISKPHPEKKICYLDLVKDCNYSIQVGDIGFYKQYLELAENKLDYSRHKAIAGNHDDPSIMPNSLGDFGMAEVGNLRFFFVRGEYSIDVGIRQIYVDWFPNEQLSYDECTAAISEYRKNQPDIVISHGCPTSIVRHFSSPDLLIQFGLGSNFESLTQAMLEAMYKAHQPKLWLFGHYHINKQITIGKTKFCCIDELSYLDLDDENIPL